MESSTVARRFCFTEEDDGLASVAEEASFSGNQHQQHHSFFFLSRPLYSQAKSSLRNLSFSSCSSPPRSWRFHDSGKYYSYEEVVANQPHFLEACSLCKKPLADNKDIFMYRGDTPFCSEECREEQMDIDEAREKWNLSASMKALMRKDQNKKSKSASPNKAQGYAYHSGTVAAA